MATGNAKLFRDAIDYKIENNIDYKNERDQITAAADAKLASARTDTERSLIAQQRDTALKDLKTKYNGMGNWLPNAYFGGGGSSMGMIEGMAIAKGVAPENQAASMSAEQLAGARDLAKKQDDGSYTSYVDPSRAEELLSSEAFNRFAAGERIEKLRNFTVQEGGSVPTPSAGPSSAVNVDDVAQRAANIVRQQSQSRPRPSSSGGSASRTIRNQQRRR